MPGVVGAQTYYTHELASRLAAYESGMPSAVENASPTTGSWDPWANLHTEMMQMRDQMDQLFTHSFESVHGDPGVGILPSGVHVSLLEQGTVSFRMGC